MDEDTERKIPTLDDLAGMAERGLIENATQVWDIIRKEALGLVESKRVLEVMTAQIKSNLEAYKQAMKDQSAISLYLRENYTAEIKQGKHKGMTFADVIIMYLSREREANRSTIVTGRPGGGIQ